MEELHMTVQLKDRVNLGILATGWLAHDNNLFDRTCSACGGMYSSFVHNVCPKCGSALTYIRIPGSQKAMCISEGTMFIALSKKQLEKDANAVKARKRAVPVVYRFKVFEFADDNGVLVPPAIHKRLRKGALVEVKTFNHQPVVTPFPSKEGEKAEIMLMVFEAYGDRIQVLSDAKATDAVTPNKVDAKGANVPVKPPVDVTAAMAQFAELQNKLGALLQTLAQGNVPTPTPPAPATKAATTVAASPADELEAAIMDDDCPFDTAELEEAGQLFGDGATVDPFKVGQ
jgi:hypothetical protein